jgi:hypothetical protein
LRGFETELIELIAKNPSPGMYVSTDSKKTEYGIYSISELNLKVVED